MNPNRTRSGSWPIFLCSAWTLLVSQTMLLRAQTADQLVTEGRAFLVASNLWQANERFLQAVATEPAHPAANVLHATTRLLVLQQQPTGSNFLSRLGLPVAGRNLYRWDSGVTNDPAGDPVIPDGMTTSENIDQLRTNVLVEIIAARANLAKVTGTNFSIYLQPEETQMDGVTLDYGDVRMLEAMLSGLEAITYTVNGWDLDAPLAALKTMATDETTTVEGVLEAYPNFLRYRTTNDLAAGRASFHSGASNYTAASDWLRSRVGSTDNLFNIDAPTTNFFGRVDDSAQKTESNFRTVLGDLNRSLTNAVVWSRDTNYTVHLTQFFSATNDLRKSLPRFHENAMVAGSWNDLTFGGAVSGISEEQLSEVIPLDVSPEIVGFSGTANGGFQQTVSVIPGRSYLVQASSNFVLWEPVSTVSSPSNTVTFLDAGAGQMPHRFYRLLDLSTVYAIQGQVYDESWAVRIAGARVTWLADGSQATTDSNGQFVLQTLVKTGRSGRIGEITIEASGFKTNSYGVYAGGSTPVRPLFSLARYYPPPSNDHFANRLALTDDTASSSVSTLGATAEPQEPAYLSGSSYYPAAKSAWWTWTASTNGQVTISTVGSSFDTVLTVFNGTSLNELTRLIENDNYSGTASRVRFNALAGTTYQIVVDGKYGAYAGTVQLTLTRP